MNDSFQIIKNRYPLLIVLLLALLLRVVGLNWGVPSDEYRHGPFHPDETQAMINLRQINLDIGDINPESGQHEGSFYYYVWLAAAETMRGIGAIEKHTWQIPNFTSEYGAVLFYGRVITVIFDLGAILLVFLALRLVRPAGHAPLLGALILALYPFEIIHSHYARAHVMANFFLAAIVYFSYKIGKRNRARYYVAVGLVAGLAIAARWPIGLALLIPFLISTTVLIRRNNLGSHQIGKSAYYLAFRNKFLLVIPTTLMGAFAGNPTLFLEFPTIFARITNVVFGYQGGSESSLTNMLDFSKVAKVLGHTIPYGSLPLLWLICYAAVIYALFVKRRYRYTLPVILFAVANVVIMGKGYPVEYVRGVMVIFPIFAILTALCWDAFLQKYSKSKRVTRAASVTLGAILLLTLLFDLDYVTAMASTDSRTRLHNLFKDNPEFQDKTIGIASSKWGYFLLHPAFDDVAERHLKEIHWGLSDVTQEYVALVDLQSFDEAPHTNGQNEVLKASSHYELMEKFDNTPFFISWLIAMGARPPHDMAYPFPVIYLYKLRK